MVQEVKGAANQKRFGNLCCGILCLAMSLSMLCPLLFCLIRGFVHVYQTYMRSYYWQTCYLAPLKEKRLQSPALDHKTVPELISPPSDKCQICWNLTLLLIHGLLETFPLLAKNASSPCSDLEIFYSFPQWYFCVSFLLWPLLRCTCRRNDFHDPRLELTYRPL